MDYLRIKNPTVANSLADRTNDSSIKRGNEGAKEIKAKQDDSIKVDCDECLK